MMITFYTILLILIVLAGVFFFDRDGFWQRLSGDPDLGRVDFATLEKGRKPNEALVCPEDFCPRYEKPYPAPVFALPAEALIEEINRKVEPLENVRRVDDGSDPLRLRYVTYSPIMRFPDTMNIEAIPLAPEGGQPRSTVAIFAKAKLGTSDMGANRKRINDWLEMLQGVQVR